MEISTGIDLGSFKIKIVAAKHKNGNLEFITKGKSMSNGIYRGRINNKEALVQSIKQVIRKTEMNSVCKIKSAYINIAGSDLKSVNINKLYENNYLPSARIPDNFELIHKIPVYNTFPKENNPGKIRKYHTRMQGKSICFILASKRDCTGIIDCLKECGIEVKGFIFSAFASAESVLGENDKKSGCVLIDIGKSMTNIAIYKNGVLNCFTCVEAGGDDISSDISDSLDIDAIFAEKILIDYGYACYSDIPSELTAKRIILNKDKRRYTIMHNIAEIIIDKLTDIFEYIKETILISFNINISDISAVLSGGVSNIRGIDILAKDIFKTEIKLACGEDSYYMKNSQIKDIAYSVAEGLAVYKFKKK